MSSTLGHNHKRGHTSTSSAQKVPCELWTMIFPLCLTPDPSPYDSPPKEVLRDSRLAPIVLSSVCQTWRHVTCNTEALWKTCWLNFEHPELNTIWLERARTSLLHLYGTQNGRDFDAAPFMRSILPFQKRWKSLEVGFGFSPRAPAGIIPRFDCPVLESFKVTVGDDIPVWVSKILLQAPQLRELALNTPWFRYPFSLTYVRLPLLTSLQLCVTYPDEIITALIMLPQLEELIAVVHFDEEELVDAPEITHTTLKQVVLSDEGVPYVLDNLTCPSLSTFHVSQTSDFDSFLDFFGRSDCHITDLDLSCHDMTAETMLDILNDDSVHAHVEKLAFSEIGAGAILELLEFLHSSQGNQRLPHLIHLSLGDCDLMNVSGGLVADVVLSRRLIPPSCECEDCQAGPQTKETRLRSIRIGCLNKVKHGLDIARLVPLPEDADVDVRDTVKIFDDRLTWHQPDHVIPRSAPQHSY